MDYRQKILEYKEQIRSYMGYLDDAGQALTNEQKLKLIKEIARLQHNVERIGNMTYSSVKKECVEGTIAIYAKLPKTIRKYNRKPAQIPYILSTWTA